MAFKIKEINRLYKEFAHGQNGKTLERVIELCEPLIDHNLMKWEKYKSYHDDFRQEISLQLWTHLKGRSEEELERYFINPYIFLYSKIRGYCHLAFKRLSRAYDLNGDIIGERGFFTYVQNEFQNPEFLYYFRNERPQELLKRGMERLEQHPALRNNPEDMKRAIDFLRELIDDYFGVKVWTKKNIQK